MCCPTTARLLAPPNTEAPCGCPPRPGPARTSLPRAPALSCSPRHDWIPCAAPCHLRRPAMASLRHALRSAQCHSQPPPHFLASPRRWLRRRQCHNGLSFVCVIHSSFTGKWVYPRVYSTRE
ncbi:hypothetical protein GUJ93_ZPchr0011g28492 [Zizania palustris]|uniref:Uncharacterized protein n=1 Tax=Zizania palustris TaxID=103762 RepID=A0A8J5WIF7_ZIZPA|nr:hypothetical protein GUJ93_ZPchr0011g28492 [Zizania palustris]